MSQAITLDEVWLGYRSGPVLSGLSLAVDAGEVMALLGPSGSGKTSVLRLILGLVAPERGTVRIGGELASSAGRIVLPPEERNVAVVFQDLALWPHLTVAGNLAFGLESRRMPREERERRIADMLRRVALAGKKRRYPGELSGGERQRVALARAMVLEPRAVLFDEPLANLDASLKCDMLMLVRELLAERTTALYVTHDIREAAALRGRIAVLSNGRISQTGTLKDLHANPASDFARGLVQGLESAGTLDA